MLIQDVKETPVLVPAKWYHPGGMKCVYLALEL